MFSVCGRVVNTIKTYNLQKHYATHSSEYENYNGIDGGITVEQKLMNEDMQECKTSESVIRLSLKSSF